MEIEVPKGCILKKDMKELDNYILSSMIMVAIDGAKSSKFALKWTLNTYLSEGEANLKLIHIRPPITMVPTPMGNHIPISQLRDDIVSAYRKDIEWQTNAMILPYKEICKRRQVDVEIVIKEANDVAEGIAEEIGKLNISKLVIGASSRNMIARKLKGFQMSTKISECSPSFCTIFVIKNGKLHAVRPGTDKSSKNERISTSSSCASSISDSMDADTLQKSLLPHNFSLEIQCAETHTIKDLTDDTGSPCSILHSRKASSNSEDSSSALSFSTSEVNCSKSKMSSYRNYRANFKSWSSELFALSDDLLEFSFLGNEDFELEKLKSELRNDHMNFEIAENASDDASQQKDEWAQFKEISIQEEDVKEASIEQEASQIGIAFCKEFTRAASLMGDTNGNATRAFKEKQSLEKSPFINEKQYNTYTWEEIQSATSSFSDKLKIGAGANATVYKGTFHHTIAAVKILNSNEDYETKQLKQELEILSKVRHPHLLKLLGACLERGCLVYEYMENGSLDDRLNCKHNTAPLPWYYRFRIAQEVASALLFLHYAKPVPIVHRDLKPANILLNENFVSKIGDVGLSTILPSMNFSMGTLCKDTAPVGTFFYIDPEYHRTGLVSPKSDTYALGMVILQLLTAKPPMGLAHTVEMALEDGNLMELLDHKAGQWPKGPAHELAHLGVSCSELRRKDRPDLKDQVIPVLDKLVYFLDKDSYLAPKNPIVPPRHFTCPIHKELMEDPCVASDGYVYDRKSIEIWFHTSDKSPITDLILPNKNLLSNLSLHSAITEWKAAAK